MGDIVSVKVEINDRFLQKKLDEIVSDDIVNREIHNLLGMMCAEYVPMQEGMLSQGYEVSSDFLRYPGPYAHYQYTGDVYGPNIPIIENGIVVGFFSIPGRKKEPTGAKLQYNREKHAKATDHWDKAMMAEKGDEFTERVKEILIRRARDMYG